MTRLSSYSRYVSLPLLSWCHPEFSKQLGLAGKIFKKKLQQVVYQGSCPRCSSWSVGGREGNRCPPWAGLGRHTGVFECGYRQRTSRNSHSTVTTRPACHPLTTTHTQHALIKYSTRTAIIHAVISSVACCSGTTIATARFVKSMTLISDYHQFNRMQWRKCESIAD